MTDFPEFARISFAEYPDATASYNKPADSAPPRRSISDPTIAAGATSAEPKPNIWRRILVFFFPNAFKTRVRPTFSDLRSAQIAKSLDSLSSDSSNSLNSSSSTDSGVDAGDDVFSHDFSLPEVSDPKNNDEGIALSRHPVEDEDAALEIKAVPDASLAAPTIQPTSINAPPAIQQPTSENPNGKQKTNRYLSTTARAILDIEKEFEENMQGARENFSKRLPPQAKSLPPVKVHTQSIQRTVAEAAIRPTLNARKYTHTELIKRKAALNTSPKPKKSSPLRNVEGIRDSLPSNDNRPVLPPPLL